MDDDECVLSSSRTFSWGGFMRALADCRVDFFGGKSSDFEPLLLTK